MLFQNGYDDGFQGLTRNNLHKSPLYDCGYDLGQEDRVPYETDLQETDSLQSSDRTENTHN